MASFNRIILVGNLTREPELKTVGMGTLCRLGVASNRQFKNKQGGKTEEVCFVDVDVWGPQAESCSQYLHKGTPVLIEGRLKFDSWKDAEGQTRSKHSIVADRVVFLSTGRGAELASAEGFEDEKPEVAAAITQQPKVQKAKKATSRGAVRDTQDTPVVAFEDEAPFEDDLPF